MKCRDCGAPLLNPNLKRCPNPRCRAWNVRVTGRIDDSTVLMNAAALSSIERIETGLVDLIFGGGIARTSVNLIGGEPGGGKTTLCLQLCDVFIERFKREALYIANEQSAEEIRATGERLELKHRGSIRIVRAMGGVTHDIGDLLLHYKPCLTILDSLTKWVGEDMAMGVIVAQRLKDYAVKLNHPIMIVNQVTKDGDHAGLKKLEHAVDMAAMFDILEGEIGEDGQPIPRSLSPRRFLSTKNRFGPAPEEQFFQMTATGLVEIELRALE